MLRVNSLLREFKKEEGQLAKNRCYCTVEEIENKDKNEIFYLKLDVDGKDIDVLNPPPLEELKGIRGRRQELPDFVSTNLDNLFVI